MPRDATKATIAMPPQMPKSCNRGSTPIANRPEVSAAPVMPPTLNMPCRLLMIARPLRLSSSEPSVLMATSNRLIEAPKITIAGSSAATFGNSSATPSRRLMDRAEIAEVLRAPSHPTMRPASRSARTVPAATASNTSESVASLSA